MNQLAFHAEKRAIYAVPLQNVKKYGIFILNEFQQQTIGGLL